MRGRKPKPTASKKLAGNPGRRPLNKKEPALPPPTKAFLDPPPELADDKAAQHEWRKIAPLLRERKVISAADRGVLMALCREWSTYHEASVKWRTQGMVVRTPSGYPIVNPYRGIATRALSNLTRLWVELGLTPSARSRIAALEDNPLRDTPEFEEDELLARLSRPREFQVVRGGKKG